MSGQIDSIHIAPAEGAPMQQLAAVDATAGRGLAGDRYAAGAGHYSPSGGDGRHITLIEAEVLADLAANDMALAPGASRRNLTTSGIALNDLVGRQFRIGDVECVGVRLCEPCTYLEGLVGQPVMKPLVHRAGLRADILVGGEIHVGDAIAPVHEEAAAAAQQGGPPVGYIDENAAARARVLSIVNGLSDDELRTPVGDWTVGAVLAHLAFWDGVHVGRLKRALAAGQPAPPPLPDGLTDVINDGTLPTWRALPGRAAISLFEGASGEADAFLRDLDPAAIEGVREAGYPRLVERFRHRTEHADSIEAALRG